jgi:hypothetical protein
MSEKFYGTNGTMYTEVEWAGLMKLANVLGGVLGRITDAAAAGRSHDALDRQSIAALNAMRRLEASGKARAAEHSCNACVETPGCWRLDGKEVTCVCCDGRGWYTPEQEAEHLDMLREMQAERTAERRNEEALYKYELPAD